MSQPLDTIQPPGPRNGVRAASRGTASNPARDNEPKPTTPRAITAPADDPDAPLQDRLVAQQWRDVVRLGTNNNAPDSLNPDGPG